MDRQVILDGWSKSQKAGAWDLGAKGERETAKAQTGVKITYC